MGSFGADPEGTMSLDDFAATMTDTYGEDYTKAYDPQDENEAYVMNLHASSDRWLGTFREISGYLNENNENMNVYTYLFDQDMPSHKGAANDEFYGCFHSSELWYTFGTLGRCWRPMTEHDFELSEEMVTFWTNFMKTGDPNGEIKNQEAKNTWEGYTKEHPYVKVFK